jgi:AcrR family transcriptional regulator
VTKEELVKGYRVHEILAAARKVIGHFGFEGTTIDRVAEEAQVAKGTIYLYFANKEDLLHNAVVEGLRELTADLQRNDNIGAPPIERLGGLIRDMFRIQNSNQDFLKALILDPRFVSYGPGDRLAEELRQVYFALLDYIASVLKSATEQGGIRMVDSHLAAFMLSEMMTGSLRRRLLGLTTTPPEADAEAVLELFLYGVRGICPGSNGR